MDEREIRKLNTWNRSASPNIIIDRKKKRFVFGHDEQFNDVMGVEQAKKAKSHHLEISTKSQNPIEKFLCNNSIAELLGKKAWFIKSDKSRFYTGYITDVLPSHHVLVRSEGKVLGMTFESCIGVGG